jgi:hypothetical protein
VDLPAFIPEELRQLARFVPTRGWDVIEWMPLMATMRSVSWRYVSGAGVRKLRSATAERVDSLQLVTSLRGAEPLEDQTTARARKKYGDRILDLYFRQWDIEQGLFLDLRSTRFAVDDGELLYAPNGLWIQLRPEFRQGMLGIYRSFYSADDSAFEAALRQMGMLQPGLSAAAEDELKALLHVHFGIDQKAQIFSIDKFKASFDELFEFFIEHKCSLHSDFVFVGFYLITLYLTLEQGGQAHNVRKICSDALLADA